MGVEAFSISALIKDFDQFCLNYLFLGNDKGICRNPSAGELPLLLWRPCFYAVERPPKVVLLEIYSFCQQLPLILIENFH